MELKHYKISDINPAKYNPRKINDDEMAGLKESIKKFGLVDPLIVNKRTNTLCGGHQRLKAAESLGFTEVPVVEVDLSLSEEKALNVALNSHMISGKYDNDILSGLLAEIKDGLGASFGDLRLDDLIVDLKLDLEPQVIGLVDEDSVPEVKDPITKSGDLWILGNHRVLCGDSTMIDHVEKLMGGEKADMVFTDPPYGVNYTKKTREVLGSKEYTEIKNDDLSQEDTKDLFFKCFSNLTTIMKDTCSYYVCSPQGGDSELMMMMMRESGMKCRHQLIWVKDAPVFSMGRLDYDYKHEPILYGWYKKHEFKRQGTQDKSVLEFKRTENKLHPTMKPVELIENFILNSTDSNQNICDLFLGSGSTLIACEKTNRKCFGMEIDPHYCDVIIQRYQQFTGKQATHENGTKYDDLIKAKDSATIAE
jgi:DNA modification methylase